ncbi:MAG: hypothetical protein ABH823_00635 [bacterium]
MTSRLSPMDAARIGLLRRAPSRIGVQFYEPTDATISLTARCPSLGCAFCAPNAGPNRDEVISRDAVSRFVLGLRDTSIDTLHLEGGEPFLEEELLLEALTTALRISGLKTIILETNLFWASSDQATERVLDRLSNLNLEGQGKTLVLAGDVDREHSVSFPIQNNVRMLRHFFDYFPEGLVTFNSMSSPDDNTVVALLEELDRLGMLEEKEEQLLNDGSTRVDGFTIVANGARRTIPIKQKLPVLVGRGRELRTDEYLAWRAPRRLSPYILGERDSLLFADRTAKEILSLGWDGLMYPDPMFMHLRTYPIGDAMEMEPYEAILLANQDRLLARLFMRGFGSVWRLRLAAGWGEEEPQDERLLVEEAAFDMLANAGRNALLSSAAMRADETDGQFLRENSSSPRDLETARARLEMVVSRNWQGIEVDLVRIVGATLRDFEPAVAVALLEEYDFQGGEAMTVLSLLWSSPSSIERKALLDLVVDSPTLCDKIFTGQIYNSYSQNQKDFARELLIMVVKGDAEAFKARFSGFDQRELTQVFLETLTDFINFELTGLFVTLLRQLPQQDLDLVVELADDFGFQPSLLALIG